ncbi:energy transducer TonB [Kordiimonas sp. SCSIO 12603]|uniref:energy transducer TonB n=1 Tax=Kordiimonas sp. SCSIO 12603 TaxID=2829596 RepID=UPI002103AA42|nr:TonB family protein [Kordiimonas sp. SCSIO 12603]UTW58123.1 energy transducer TonB [Kordiimonas sp. SCSIO 12603]
MSILKNTVFATVITMSAALPAISSETTKNWQDAFRSKLANANQYPNNALNRNIEGTVKIRVKFDKDGSVKGAEVFQSSGHKVLDKEALQSVIAVKSLPSLPDNHKEMSVIVPVVFQIQDRAIARSTSSVRVFASAHQ